jgi:hypothetical protein
MQSMDTMRLKMSWTFPSLFLPLVSVYMTSWLSEPYG